MTNFNDKSIVDKFGSWVLVQVAFYDFLFERATKICAAHWKEEAVNAFKNFRDGEDFYENTVKQIEAAFETEDDAWNAFKEEELLGITK